MLSLPPGLCGGLLSSFQPELSAGLRSLREANQALRDSLTQEKAESNFWYSESRRQLKDKLWYIGECYRLLAEDRTQQWDVRISSPLTDAEAWTGLDFPCSPITWQSCWFACPMCKRPLELTPSPSQKTCDAPLSWK